MSCRLNPEYHKDQAFVAVHHTRPLDQQWLSCLRRVLFLWLESPFPLILRRNSQNYVLVVLGLLLLRMQTQRVLSLKGDVGRLIARYSFSKAGLSMEGEHEGLYNEFDPLEERGREDGNEDPESWWNDLKGEGELNDSKTAPIDLGDTAYRSDGQSLG